MKLNATWPKFHFLCTACTLISCSVPDIREKQTQKDQFLTDLQRVKSWKKFIIFTGCPKKNATYFQGLCMKFDVKVSWFWILPEIGYTIWK